MQHGQRWSQRCEKTWRKTEDEGAAEAEDANGGGDEDAEEVALCLRRKQTLLPLNSCASCGVQTPRFLPPAFVTLMSHYGFSSIVFCRQSVVAAGHREYSATSTSDPDSFPNCCKILKLYVFTRGIFQNLLRLLFGLPVVGG